MSNDNLLDAWPPGSRPQDDPSFSGKGLKFETLDHGGDYPDMMPQAIRVTDPEDSSCEYWAVHPGAGRSWRGRSQGRRNFKPHPTSTGCVLTRVPRSGP